MNDQRRKVCIEKTSTSTPEQKASAERNRDALTLMLPQDRVAYAGQYAVVVRVGASAGKVIGFGRTRDEAVEVAQKHVDFDPLACSVRYVIPSDEHILATLSPSSSKG